LTLSYIKIVPIRPWEEKFNISIWYFNLKGIDNDLVVKKSIKILNNKKDYESMINCLNFLKKKRLNKCCNLLQKSVKLTEEKKMMNKLYNLCIDGKFSECITELSKPNLFQKYINNSKITYKWKRVDLMEKEAEFILNFLSKEQKHNTDKVINNIRLDKKDKEKEIADVLNNNLPNNNDLFDDDEFLNMDGNQDGIF